VAKIIIRAASQRRDDFSARKIRAGLSFWEIKLFVNRVGKIMGNLLAKNGAVTASKPQK